MRCCCCCYCQVGGTLSGFLSDYMIRRAQKKGGGLVGQRVKIIIVSVPKDCTGIA